MAGRLGLLVAVLLLVACAPSGPSLEVSGRVDLGPFCPVEVEGSPCPVPPQAFTGRQVVATFEDQSLSVPLSSDGSFVLSLPAGTWSLTSDAGMSCQPLTVSSSAQVTLVCDTGIR